MSKNSSKQLVEQVKEWTSWLKFAGKKVQDKKPAKRKSY